MTSEADLGPTVGRGSPAAEAASELSVAVLGPVEVLSRAGVLVEPAGMLAKRFIAVLALAGGRTVATATLVDELWQDHPPAGARQALQTLVSRLRAACADGLIETSASGYRLTCRPDQIDLVRAERFLSSAAPGISTRAIRSTLDLWRGEAGPDLGDSELRSELGTRSEAAREALDRLYADLLSSAGEYERAIGVLRSLLLEHPFDDRLVLRLITTLAATGRPGEALTAFEAHRRRLRDELGATPSAEVLAAHAALLRESDSGVAPGARGANTAGPAVGATPTVAPRRPVEAPAAKPLRLGVKAAPNELIGRDDDVEAVNEMLKTARLVTILGAGGLGKTRLSQALAGDEARGSSSVIFVELASVRSPDDLLLAVAQASGIREAQAATRLVETPVRDDLDTRIRGRLAERPTLLVLDNCEHIVESVAVWAAHTLEQVSTLRMLATSRSPLQVAAERVYSLGPLLSGSGSTVGSTVGDFDASQPVGPAVQLFYERARAARPSVVLRLETVERLCDRLDGMPLAIELAAARVRSMTVDEIERRLTNRFALLTGGDRTAPERHQTLLAVIDWSWNLLGDAERQLLRRLSLFPDGFSEAAAEWVGGALEPAGSTRDARASGESNTDLTAADPPIADLLDALVNQSLVAVTESELTGAMRYRMLETVREFGQMALVDAGEDTAVTVGMARWACSFARATTPLLDGATQITAFKLVTEEQDNLVDILRRALDLHDGETATFAFSVLCAYWTMRGAHWEVMGFGRPFLEATRAYDPEAVDPARPVDDRHIVDAVEASVRCLAMVGAVGLFSDLRTGATARARLQRLTRIDEVTNERMRIAARFVMNAGSEPALQSLMRDARESRDPMTSSYAWLTSTQYAENSGDIRDALEYGARGYEQALIAEDVWTQAMMASMLAQLHSQSGHPNEALHWASLSRTGLVELNADDDLQQLEWLIAMNRLMVGESDDASDALRVLTERSNSPEGTVSPDMFSRDTVSIGWSGQAEIDRMNGDTPSALANFHRALDFFASPRERSSPWYLMLSSVYLCAITLDGIDDPDELVFADGLMRRIRSRILATHRIRPQYLDLPVLGCALVGLSARLLTRHADEALPLLALAEKLGSRQDSPAIYRDQHFARASALCGPERVAAARAGVADLDPRQSAALAFELLKESRALRW
ncbi:AfsR/SARP family transcriptional regulator [Subtercola endophyticus]|uniref:AfsR/SARP family transcriptional regulator n=1 Tax=Subtercola endophyticus TaxID=2895559 RepID=UPI001E51CEEE|nr:BTAD domain-containing putative transcriptional regulator [Subtercola endophyticus]UFS59750.1 AAA family ATPase [Subtercola endophyticus]